jgi:L-ascorbate metabolism protein UlaG (beta-lactamase superfamily)
MTADELRSWVKSHMVWYGQSTFLLTLNNGIRLYIDPFQLPEGVPKADLLFVTHSHPDHFEPRSVKRILQPTTRVISSEPLGGLTQVRVGPGQDLTFEGIPVRTYHAYNRRGFPHPRSKNWVGFHLTVDGVRLYHAGDTDSETELRDMKPDVAFLPIMGIAGFSVAAGVEAAKSVGATLTVPIHYGVLPGTGKNGVKFCHAYQGESLVLEKSGRDR